MTAPPLKITKVNPVNGGVTYTGWEEFETSAEIAVYLGNGLR